MIQNVRRKALTIAVVIATFSLNACAGLFGLSGDSWQEEVLLHDGSKVVVERQTTRGGRHEVGQKPSYTQQTLIFTHPATGEQIVWEDKATPDLGNSAFLLMALDIYHGTAHLVANPMGCLSYNKWGRPNPPYVVFRYDSKNWVRIPLQELPPETKTPNLIVSSPDTKVENFGKRFVDAETIKRLNSGFRQPEYKAILREPVEIEEMSCIKADYYMGAGWLSPDWFSSHPTIEACKKFCQHKNIGADVCPCETVFKGK